MTVRKAVLTVAGLGTRFLPATKAIAKEMIPVIDKPVIQYVVEEAVAAGIREFVLVTHSAKRSIEDHFDTNYELESALAARGKQALLETVQNIVPADVTFSAVRQGRPLGLGHAVLCAREVIGDAPFAVLLPDVLVDQPDASLRNDMARMIQRFDETGHAQVMVENVPRPQVNQYGVVALDGDAPTPGNSTRMTAIVEKPAPEQAPSTLAVVGRYVFNADIFERLANTAPGVGNEIQLTDAIADLLHHAPVDAYRMAGVTYDCGSKAGYLAATMAYAARHPQLASVFSALVEQYAANRFVES